MMWRAYFTTWMIRSRWNRHHNSTETTTLQKSRDAILTLLLLAINKLSKIKWKLSCYRFYQSILCSVRCYWPMHNIHLEHLRLVVNITNLILVQVHKVHVKQRSLKRRKVLKNSAQSMCVYTLPTWKFPTKSTKYENLSKNAHKK